MKRISRRLLVAAGLTFGGFMRIGAGSAQNGIDLGKVVAQRGVAVAVRGDEPVPLTIGSTITVSDRVRTAAGAKLEIELRRGGTLVIGPESNVLMEKFSSPADDGPIVGLINLLSGVIRLVLHEVPQGSEIDVRTSAAVAMVRGTEFVVQTQSEAEQPMTSVFVASGNVLVQGNVGPAVTLLMGDGCEVALGEAAGPVMQWGASQIRRVLRLVTIS